MVSQSDLRFKGVAEPTYQKSVKSQSREELFKDFQEGGRYGDIVGIFHASDGFGRSDKEFFEALPTTCKIFAHKGAGYDSVDVHAAKARGESSSHCAQSYSDQVHGVGVLVSNTPGAVDEATATTAVFLLIATVRKFSECEAIVRSGGFSVPPTIQSGAHDLSDRTVGVLGLGGIGLHIVNYIRPFGMPIFYHNRKPSLEAPSGITYCPDLYDMLGRIDILMVSIPLNASTRGFIGEKEIRAMKKGSIIVNTARGPIIDEEAMIKALQDGHVGLHSLSNQS